MATFHVPEDYYYTKDHEWAQVDENIVTVGITEFAQNSLGEIVYVELPEVGDKVVKDDPFGAVESVKAVSDLYAPVSGTVLEFNDALPETPETINEDPYGDGWMIKVEMTDIDDLKDLMDAYPEAGAEFRRRYAMSWYHHENALEGIVLTEQELIQALEHHVVGDASLMSVLTVIRNHRTAYEAIEAEASSRNRLPPQVEHSTSPTRCSHLARSAGESRAASSRAGYRPLN